MASVRPHATWFALIRAITARSRAVRLRRCVWLVALLGLAGAASPVRAANDGLDARLQRAKAEIEQALAKSNMPGLVIGVTGRQRLRMVVTHGYADLKQRKPLTPDSRFAIGSMTKGFTAIALMQLAEARRFDPDAPISKYVPAFKLDSKFRPVTG